MGRCKLGCEPSCDGSGVRTGKTWELKASPAGEVQGGAESGLRTDGNIRAPGEAAGILMKPVGGSASSRHVDLVGPLRPRKEARARGRCARPGTGR